jgi:uridine phosphorylase
VPSRLRPTASYAADAILVGDPGRALLLAQELLTRPKMSNHARGLWGYSGETQAGRPLTIQSTGIGGPSAALVLGDLAKLGTKRALRIGTCVGFEEATRAGELLVVEVALAAGGSATAHGVAPGEIAKPDDQLTARLVDQLRGDGRVARVASFDVHPRGETPPEGAVAGDMQTAPLLARSVALGIAAAALLIVAETAGGEPLDAETLVEAEKRAGHIAAATLST